MKFIILDRDGVINEDSDDYIKSPAEWIPIPGSLESIARLNHAGYKVVVATNQSGLARGLFNIDALNKIHQKMHHSLDRVGGHVEAIYFCPHGPDDHCQCRKPKPGMLIQIGETFSIDLKTVFVVGDSYRDIQSAQAINAIPLLVLTGKGKHTLESHPELINEIPVFDNLSACVDFILKDTI